MDLDKLSLGELKLLLEFLDSRLAVLKEEALRSVYSRDLDKVEELGIRLDEVEAMRASLRNEIEMRRKDNG